MNQLSDEHFLFSKDKFSFVQTLGTLMESEKSLRFVSDRESETTMKKMNWNKWRFGASELTIFEQKYLTTWNKKGENFFPPQINLTLK